MTSINWNEVQKMAVQLKTEHEKWHLANSNWDYRTNPEATQEHLRHNMEIRNALMEKIGEENLKKKENGKKLNQLLQNIFKIDSAGKKVSCLNDGNIDPLILNGLKKDNVPAVISGLNDPAFGNSLKPAEILKNLRENLDKNFWTEKKKHEMAVGPDGKTYEYIRFVRNSSGEKEYGKWAFQMIDALYKPEEYKENEIPIVDITTVYEDIRQSLYRFGNGEFLQDTTYFRILEEHNHSH